MELCRALRVSRSPHSMLRLRINKLDISCLGVPRTVVLLEQLDPEVKEFHFDSHSPDYCFGTCIIFIANICFVFIYMD